MFMSNPATSTLIRKTPTVCGYCGTHDDVPTAAHLPNTPTAEIRAHHASAECVAMTEPSERNGGPR